MLRFVRLLAIAGALAVSACGGDSPEAKEVGGPPWGLDEVRLPNTPAAVAAGFEALPKRLDGAERNTDVSEGRFFVAQYRRNGRESFLRAAPLQSLPTRPRLTPLDHLRILARGADVEAQSLKPRARVVYVAVKTQVDLQPAYAAAWGAPRGKWLFSAVAETAEARAELIEAFVEALPAAG